MVMGVSNGFLNHSSSNPFPLSSLNSQTPFKSFKDLDGVNIGYSIRLLSSLFS